MDYEMFILLSDICRQTESENHQLSRAEETQSQFNFLCGFYCRFADNCFYKLTSMVMDNLPAVFKFAENQSEFPFRIILFTRERPTAQNLRRVFR